MLHIYVDLSTDITRHNRPVTSRFSGSVRARVRVCVTRLRACISRRKCTELSNSNLIHIFLLLCVCVGGGVIGVVGWVDGGGGRNIFTNITLFTYFYVYLS